MDVRKHAALDDPAGCEFRCFYPATRQQRSCGQCGFMTGRQPSDVTYVSRANHKSGSSQVLEGFADAKARQSHKTDVSRVCEKIMIDALGRLGAHFACWSAAGFRACSWRRSSCSACRCRSSSASRCFQANMRSRVAPARHQAGWSFAEAADLLPVNDPTCSDVSRQLGGPPDTGPPAASCTTLPAHPSVPSWVSL
jgi:hypothetical protein